VEKQNQKIKKRTNIFLKGAIIAFILFCLLTVFSQLASFTELEKKQILLEDQLYAMQEDIAELEEEIAQPVDDNYIKRVARALLNYHLPEEILFFNDLVD